MGACARATERVTEAVNDGVTVVGVDANEHCATAPASCTDQPSVIREMISLRERMFADK